MEEVLVAPTTTSTTKASIRFATFLCEISASFLSKRGKLVGAALCLERRSLGSRSLYRAGGRTNPPLNPRAAVPAAWQCWPRSCAPHTPDPGIKHFMTLLGGSPH